MSRGVRVADARPAELPEQLDSAIDGPSARRDGGLDGWVSGTRTGEQEIREAGSVTLRGRGDCVAVPCAVEGA